MRKMLVIVMVATAICLQGCDKNVFYAEERDVDETGWNMAKPLAFDVNIQDTLQVYDFFIDVRNSVHYTKANVFFFINTTFPDGSMALDTMEYPLADPSGQWLGKRSGRYVDTRYYFRRNARFPMQGNYHFAITNGMRDSAITGLEHIDLRIEYSTMN